MVYRKPFTAVQRREAVREYKSFRANLRLLRETFGPRTTVEKAAFAAYRQRVREIKLELVVADRRVDVARLNDTVKAAQSAMAEYLQAKYFK